MYFLSHSFAFLSILKFIIGNMLPDAPTQQQIVGLRRCEQLLVR
jgi:hypothetical protein